MSQLWVQLGRNGDILNVLPLLLDEAQKGRDPSLMVARPYAGLLDGLGYVKPVVFEGEAQQLKEALDQAQAIDKDYICTQVNGPKELVRDLVYMRAGMPQSRTTSYQKEMWKLAGKKELWGTQLEHPHGQLPLVFDKRDKAREAKLIEGLKLKGKKTVLVCADGLSSPFRYKTLLLELLKLTGYRVIDLATVKAERLFDLIGLMEVASALVSIDTAPLHLAAAVPDLPVFALTRDEPQLWNGSAWKAQHVWYCRYSDFPDRAVEMLEALKGVKKLGHIFAVHTWNGLRGDPTEVYPGPLVRPLPILKGMMGRMGPTKEDQHPYLKDVLSMAIQAAATNQFVMLTRAGVKWNDLSAGPDEPFFAYRLKDGQYSPFTEMFCARADWWLRRMNQIPDVLLNHDFYWSEALWAVFKAAGAEDLTGIVTREPSEGKASPANVSPSTEKNIAAQRKAFADLKIYSRYPKISEQIETYPLHAEQLFPFGYNPSIVPYDNGFLFAYRYHPTESKGTHIAIAKLDSLGGSFSDNRVLLSAEGSADDPRFFRHPDGTHCISWVDSTWPKVPPTAVIKWAMLADEDLTPIDIQQWALGKNDGTAIEKNWVFWWDKEKLLNILYSTSPKHVVFDPAGTPCETDGPTWPYGQPRGGTVPMEYEGNLIRFFHSSTRSEVTGVRHRYYLGAYVMEKQPPYKVLAVSRKPILYGSEVDDLKPSQRPHHWLANIVFPGGAVPIKDGWCVSIGVNDAVCALVKVTPERLNL